MQLGPTLQLSKFSKILVPCVLLPATIPILYNILRWMIYENAHNVREW